eukprot:3932268-Amphidinium_carterae.1
MSCLRGCLRSLHSEGIALPAASPPLAAELDLAVFGDNGLPSDRGNWFSKLSEDLADHLYLPILTV